MYEEFMKKYNEFIKIANPYIDRLKKSFRDLEFFGVDINIKNHFVHVTSFLPDLLTFDPNPDLQTPINFINDTNHLSDTLRIVKATLGHRNY